MRFHSQNLTDGKLSLWRDGRCWIGRWEFCWNVFRHPQLSIGVHKGGYDHDGITAHVQLILFSLFVTRSFSRTFESRELSIGWNVDAIHIHLWTDDEWHRDRPWHRNVICLHVADWILGKTKYSHSESPSVPVLIPMPEGCYRAQANAYRQEWRRRFGIRKVSRGWEFEIDGGIPFAGKGENSWDCGDDGLWSMGAEGSLEDGIGRVVASVLESRKRYGNASFIKESQYVMAPAKAS